MPLHLQGDSRFIYLQGTLSSKPLERLESQQGNVDWLRFWLQDYENSDPAKRAQYTRWRLLREETHQGLGSTEKMDAGEAVQPLSH